jgi:hypothetical protein
MVYVYGPAVVGVPENVTLAPVAALSDNPGGAVPTMVQLYGAAPAVAVHDVV